MPLNPRVDSNSLISDRYRINDLTIAARFKSQFTSVIIEMTWMDSL